MTSLLHREEAAQYLRARWGFKISAWTLAAYASRGSGPKYSRAGHVSVYATSHLDEWAQSRISHPAPRNTLANSTDSLRPIEAHAMTGALRRWSAMLAADGLAQTSPLNQAHTT